MAVKTRLVAFLAVVLSFVSRGAAAEDEVFAADQSLIAVARCASLERSDAACQALLSALNPFYRGKNPFLSLIAPWIHNDRLKNVRKDGWLEMVRFAQPQENGNSWTYVFSITDERQYVADLLALGTIRQEVQEKSITRYRHTSTAGQKVFHLVFIRKGAKRLAIIGENFHAVDRTRTLYLPRMEKGLLNSAAGLAVAFHGTRFYLADTQFLPRMFSILQQDLAVELAGVTAKPDNAGVVFLRQLLHDAERLVKEMAVLRADLEVRDGRLRLNAGATLRYGGSLHYALAASTPQDAALAACLPERARTVARVALWPEVTGQFLELVGGAINEALPVASRPAAAGDAQKWLRLFNKANLRASACGVVPGEGTHSGPVAVGLLKWEKPESLGEFWDATVHCLSDSLTAEALSERGIKWEIVTDPTAERIGARWNVYRTAVTGRAQSFTLPGILAGTQRFLVALHGDVLALVAPAAPLDLDQYRIAEPYMLKVMTETLYNLAGAAGKSPKLADDDLRGISAQGTFFQMAAHPLRFLQMAMQGEAVWPQPGEAERLPVPWVAYHEEIRNFPAKGQPLVWRFSAPKNHLAMTVEIPVATLAECAAALLDCRPAENSPGKDKPGKNASRPAR